MECGIQIGFIQERAWSGFVTVTNEGPFEAVLQIQRAGRYRVMLASCIEGGPWQAVRRHWLRGALGLLTGGFMPNRLHLSTLGWMRAR